MKHFIIHAVIALAIAFACMQLNGAQSSDPSPQQPAEEGSISKPESQNTPPAMPSAVPKLPESIEEGIKINVKVKMVQVNAVVKDRFGNVVPNLRKEDFKVYDNNVLQEVAGFSQDELPLALAWVFDRGGGPYKQPLGLTFRHLRAQDAACIIAFDKEVSLIHELTADLRRMLSVVPENPVQYNVRKKNVIDALHYAIKYLASAAPDHRHAIILISDNDQTMRSVASEREVITMAQEKNVTVYSLKYPINLYSAQDQFAKGASVEKIALESGGAVFTPKRLGIGFWDIITSGFLLSRLRTTYSFGYYPSDTQTGAFHTITVKLADKFGKPGIDYFIQAKKAITKSSLQSPFPPPSLDFCACPLRYAPRLDSKSALGNRHIQNPYSEPPIQV
jgi:Ca-activated chloride channel homolog